MSPLLICKTFHTTIYQNAIVWMKFLKPPELLNGCLAPWFPYKGYSHILNDDLLGHYTPSLHNSLTSNPGSASGYSNPFGYCFCHQIQPGHGIHCGLNDKSW